MRSANKYHQDGFISSFWYKSIEVMSRNNVFEFTTIPEHINLDDVFVLKEYRKIRNDHTFSYGNKFYLIESPLKHSIVRLNSESIVMMVLSPILQAGIWLYQKSLSRPNPQWWIWKYRRKSILSNLLKNYKM